MENYASGTTTAAAAVACAHLFGAACVLKLVYNNLASLASISAGQDRSALAYFIRKVWQV
jgi:hypothetical protein